jgi:hypothetical protein
VYPDCVCLGYRVQLYREKVPLLCIFFLDDEPVQATSGNVGKLVVED